jgi:hypothetical protein
MDDKFELYELRNFSSKFNYAADFLRQNAKPLGKSILYILGPFYLLLNIFILFLAIDINKGMSTGLMFFVSLTMFFVGTLVLKSIVFSYMKIFFEDPYEPIEVKTVWKVSRKYILSMLGAFLVTKLLVSISFFFFIIPAIYVGVVFSIIYPIVVFEDKGFVDALTRCFELMKEKWWSTWGIQLVFVPVVTLFFIGFVRAGFSLYGIIQTAFSFNLLFEELYIFWFTLIFFIIFFVLYAIYSYMYVVLAFQYGYLVERKESTGIISKINNIGNEEQAEISI